MSETTPKLSASASPRFRAHEPARWSFAEWEGRLPQEILTIKEESSSRTWERIVAGYQAAFYSQRRADDRFLEIQDATIFGRSNPGYWEGPIPKDKPYLRLLDKISLRAMGLNLSDKYVKDYIALACDSNDWGFLETFAKLAKVWNKHNLLAQQGRLPKRVGTLRDGVLISNWLRFVAIDPKLPGFCWMTDECILACIIDIFEQSGFPGPKVGESPSIISARSKSLGLRKARSLIKVFDITGHIKTSYSKAEGS